MPYHTLFTVLLICLWLVSVAAVAEETVQGAGTAPAPVPVPQGCMACHGPAGNSQGPAVPIIAGLPRDYGLAVLQAYRHGGRFSTLMGRLLDGYSDTELAEMADYFSRQRPAIPRQRVDWDRVFRGRQLHRRYCRECHGDRDRQPEAGVPRLNGQWMAYLRWTLQDYLLGASQADLEMTEALIRMIRRHGEEALEALIHYYGSARPEPPGGH